MRLSVSPPLSELAPGENVQLLVTIVNDGDQPLAASLTVNGVDPYLLSLPDTLDVLDPGEATSALIGIQFPPTAAPGDQRVGISVTDPDGLHDDAWTSATIRVGARPDVAIAVLPATARGRRGAKLQTILHNRSSAPIAIVLDSVGEGVDVSFAADELVLGPGEDLHVPTRMHRIERTWFRERRHGTLVQARSEGAPVSAAATFTQRPSIPGWLWKSVAFVAVLAVWAAAVVVIQDRILGADVDPAKLYALNAASEAAFAAAARGEDVDGAVDPVDFGPGAPVVVQGSVAGPADPVGTDVVIERIAFGDEGTTQGDATTRLAALTPVAAPIGAVIDRIATSTDERGAFSFSSGLAAPAFYRVTARRPGFDVASQVVTTTDEVREATVDLVLVPAAGAMSGRVTDTSGTPLGGATITVTDGALLYSATSATEGQVGTWSLSGLATPASYQVIVSLPGHATATLLATLDGGEQLSGVDAELAQGLGTIRGQVTHRGDGVGAVTVELEGEEAARTTTTLTEAGLRGAFDFPALPYGTYRLTFSAPGWLTQSSEVVVDRGDVEVLVTDLRPSTAVVQGRVLQEVAPGGACEYPDPADPSQREQAEFQPCGGVGVSVVGDDQTWRTTTANGTGTFQLSGISPGEYLVSFERFGYVSQYLDISVQAGDVVSLPGEDPTDAVHLDLLAPVNEAAGEIQGVVRDATDPSTMFQVPAGTVISIDDQPGVTVERLADGAFRITGVLPGAHTLRIEAPGYDVLTEVVRVAFGTPADAGVLAITPLGSLALRITGGQSSVVGDAEVFVGVDPAAYEGTGRTAPVLEAAAGVTFCTRTIPLDGTQRTLDGVCATTDAVGDVEFRRSFGTGNYVMATPANAQDAATDEASRATTVPLDHEQLIRRVDIDSGQTVRLDPSLRRYPIVSGSIRAPATVGTGLRTVDVTRDNIQFRAIDASGNVLTLPAGTPTPRISASGDPGSTLDPGRYRIDRIPADTATEQYQWQLVISADGDVFERGIGQPGGPIDGLQFNESRTVSAMMLPAPQALQFVLTYDDPSGTPTPVPDGRLRLFGVSGYAVFDEAPFFAAIETTCPSDQCVVAPGEGEVAFDFTSETTDPRVLGFGATALLRTGVTGYDAPGELDVPPFYRPGPLDVSVSAPGFEAVELEDHPIESADPGPFVIPVKLEAKPRAVSGTVLLSPALSAADYPAFMGTDLGVPDDATILTGLTGRLVSGSVDVAAVIGTDGTFLTVAVPPGSYTLSLGGEGIEDRDVAVEIVPGEGDVVLPAADTTVIRTGVLRVEVDGNVATRDITEYQAQLARRVGTAAYADVGTATTCSATAVPTGSTTCDATEITWTDLPLFDSPLSGPRLPYDYRVTITADGYLDEVVVPVRLDTLPYQLRSVGLDRYGEVGGLVQSTIGTDAPVGLGGATVTLIDSATGSEILLDGNPVTVTTASDGTFVFPPTLEVPARVGNVEVCTPQYDAFGLYIGDVCQDVVNEGDRYGLRIDAATFDVNGAQFAGYDPVTLATPFTFALNSVVTDADATLPALATSITGVVLEEGTLAPLYDDGVDGVAVTVTVVKIDGVAVVGGPSVQTRAPAAGIEAGSFLLPDLEARTYTLTFETSGDRPILERDVVLVPGEHRDLGDVIMASAFGSAGGTVTLERYSGATTSLGENVEVRAWIADSGSRPALPTAVTAADGTFTLDDLEGGSYTVEFLLDGYETVTRLLVPISPSTTTPVDATLTASTVPLLVTVTSTSNDIGGINDVEVTATDVSDPVTDGTAPDVVASTAKVGGDDGRVTLDLPPGEWEVSLENTEAPAFQPRPHVQPAVQSRTITPAGTAPTTVAFSLSPFVRIAGTAAPEAFLGGPTPAEFDGAVVTAATSGLPVRNGIVAASDASELVGGITGWEVYVPPTASGNVSWLVSITATGYETRTINPGNINSQNRDVTVSTQVDLPAFAVATSVTVTSGSTSTPLEDAAVTATWAGTGAGPPDAAPYDLSGTSDATGKAALTLAPGDWDIAVDASAVSPPHASALVEDEHIPVTITGTTIDVPVALTPYVTLSGDVRARMFEGAAPSGAPVASVTASDGNVTVDGTIASFVDGVAVWSVPVPPTVGTAVAWTVTVTAADYVSASEILTLAEDRTVTPLVPTGIDLVASPVDVDVSVTSSGSGSALETVSVVATWNGVGPGPASPADAAYTLSDVTDSLGVATLTLWPGDWSLTTTGTQDVTFSPRPHANGSLANIDVAPGGATVPASLALALDPYVSVAGTVSTTDGVGGTPVLAAGVTVSVPGGLVDTGEAADRSVTGTTGAWKVWLPQIPAGPSTVTVSFDLTGYDTGTFVIDADTFVPDPAQPAVVVDDATIADTVELTPSTRAVTVSLTSAAGTASLDGLQLTAEREKPDTTLLSESAVVSVAVVDTVTTATATFSALLPGTWTIKSTNGSDATRLAVTGTEPHIDLRGIALTVPIGTGTYTPAGQLAQYAAMSGTVVAEAYPADPVADPPPPIAGASVTVAQVVSTVSSTATATTDSAGAWTIGVVPSIAATVNWSATGYESPAEVSVPAGSLASTTTPHALGAQKLLPITVEAVVLSSSTGNPPIAGAEVLATLVGGTAADDVTRFTDADGKALFALAPGDWQLDVVTAAAHYVKGDDPNYTSPATTTVICCALQTVNFVLTANSVLIGTVAEQRGDDQLPIPGVTIEATREGESFRTTSVEVGADGTNYRLRMRSGTWRITATRDGQTIVVDEAFVVRKDEEGSEPNRLDILLPTGSIDLAGQVLGGGGAVAGATITAVSSVGTVTATSGDDGAYELTGLDNTVTWAITFSPPAGYEARAVTRYVALSGNLTATIALDQVLPSALGTIELRITGGEAGTDVAVTLTEATSFPTLDADGRIDASVRLDAQGAGTLLLEDLVPGDGHSVPQDRFSLGITAPGLEPIQRTGLDVAPGGTTTVTVDLGIVAVSTRELVLTLFTAGGEPITDRTVVLADGSSTIPSTVEAGTNVYTFANVAPGTWRVVLEGFEDGEVVVPAGDDTFAWSVSLVAVPEQAPSEPDPALEEEQLGDPETSETAPDDGTTADGTTVDAPQDGSESDTVDPSVGDGTGDADEGTVDTGTVDGDVASGDGDADGSLTTDDSGTGSEPTDEQ